MKAMVIDGFGGPEKLHWAELPTPVAGPGEILIKLAATSVNPVEWKIREGYLAQAFPHRFPLILGWDAAGTVAALGPNVHGFQPGDAVYAYVRKPEVQWGSYADYVVFDAQHVAFAPRGLSLEAASTLPLVGLTAWQVLFDTAKLDAGQTVLIHAGAGGIGSLAIQLAKAKNARVITTARAENHAYVTGLGADVAIDYTAGPFAEAVRKAAPGGVDVVFDTMGGETQAASWSTLRPGGILVSIVDPPDEAAATAKGCRAAYVFVSPNGEELRDLAALVEAGKVKPPAIEVLPLGEAAAAHEKSRDHHTRGKIVLKIG